MQTETMSYEMNELLELVFEQNASDLHLQVGQPPTLRLSGSMTPIDGPPLQPIDTEKLMLAITPDVHIQSTKLNGGRRLRVRLHGEGAVPRLGPQVEGQLRAGPAPDSRTGCSACGTSDFPTRSASFFTAPAA